MDTIVNWLWQGAVVAAVVTVGLRGTRRLSPTTRHRLWWIALVLVLLLTLLPAAQAMWRPDLPTASTLPSSATPTPYVIPVPRASWWVLAAGAGLWFLWFAVTVSRISAALVMLNSAKRSARVFPADREARLTLWNSVRGQGRPARLVLSDDVRLAAVLGVRSPVIALSPELLSRVTDGDLDRIVVHEWAHVQRRDDLGRLGQTLVSAAAGLHPAVWWIDRQIQLEREIACDDWAINLTGSAKAYAACLTRLASLGRPERAALVPAALSSPPQLTRRIMRLLDASRSTSTKTPAGPIAAIGTCMLAAAAMIANVELIVTAAAIEIPISIITEQPSGGLVDTSRMPIADGAIGRRGTGQPHQLPPAPATAPNQAAVSKEPTPVQPPAREPAATPMAQPATEFPTLIQPVTELPGSQLAVVPPAAGADGQTKASDDAPRPWGAAADAGVNIGKGSQKAAVATAGFFTRVSKSIVRSFK
jgi:beta-lactamase regulating signal transducer with metallopeptidase domain